MSDPLTDDQPLWHRRPGSAITGFKSARLPLFIIYLQALISLALCIIPVGCDEFFARDADREVYRLIEKRQRQALGATTDVRIDGPAAKGNEPDSSRGIDDPYTFVPHPVDNDVPESFKQAPTATRPAVLPPEPEAEELRTEIGKGLPQAAAEEVEDHEIGWGPPDPFLELRAPTDGPLARHPAGRMPPPGDYDSPPPAPVVPGGPTTAPAREELTLEQALAYTFRHSRDFQNAKEQLYLAALDLTLERHLWTPRFFGEVSSLYSIRQNPETDSRGNTSREPDNTLTAVARAGVRQRLPYGGEVVAEVINSLVRDVSNHITDGETGQTVIQADLPLLRGAGRSAFETRYQAERNLIYAIRTFEGFRRNLVVLIAADYFNLQRLRQQIVNTEQSVQSFAFLADQTRALFGGGRRTVLDVQRADQERLGATNDRVDAITVYQSTLDAFKLRIGMPVETPIDVPFPSEPMENGSKPGFGADDSLEAALRMPAISEEDAIAAGMKYRLDLLNDLDRIGDAERGVHIAENNLLPDLRATSSVRFNTRDEQRGVGHYDDEHNVYEAGLTLELPLDRKAERNALRRSIVDKNAAQRGYEEARYTVVFQIRNAMRRIDQQQLSLQIQIKNRDLALQRREAAQFQLDRGLIGNRDLVEAENALLSARNRLASAQAELSLAILQFRRDTGTLRVDDEGKWTAQGAEVARGPAQ